MPNPNVILYSTATQSGALRKGNFYLGVTDKDYGPSNVTGYYGVVSFHKFQFMIDHYQIVRFPKILMLRNQDMVYKKI